MGRESQEVPDQTDRRVPRPAFLMTYQSPVAGFSSTWSETGNMIHIVGSWLAVCVKKGFGIMLIRSDGFAMSGSAS